MIQLLTTSPGTYFAIVMVVVVSIVLHELAHGAAAIWFGDRTPIETGHKTLNPIVHMGGLSLILLALVGIAWGQMPVNTARMRGRYADFWVSAAGPATNVILAIIGVIGLGLMYRMDALTGGSQVTANGGILLEKLAVMNFALAMLNLVPVPPLDGSHMLANVSPAYRRLLDGDLARGAATALMFAVFLGGGRFLFGAAYYLTERGLNLVIGGA